MLRERERVKKIRKNHPQYTRTGFEPQSPRHHSLVYYTLDNVANEAVAVCSLSVTTRLSNVYPLWTAGRASDMPFIVSAVVHYPEETILYRPGFWQVIKWAWVQYLSVFIIFVFIFRLIKEYVFSNQLVFTVKTVPWKKLF
uniref:Transmembrane protein 231 n=1 Tax=Timema bartmani TaxID=61472 RepID=A0A7R9EM21_9NEOP|nr:unnamed protein product [Timema bartmani]